MAEAKPPETEIDVMRRAMALLEERMPAGWSVRSSSAATDRVDGLIEVSDPAGNSGILIIEAKRVIEGRDVAHVREQLAESGERLKRGQGLVAARYLSPPVRAKLAEAGLSFIDATGNMRVQIASPGLYIADRGADSDPWRGPGRPRGTLKGLPAARVVRAISDFSGPWAIRELVEVSKASTGATYRVIDFLEREGMATRNKDGRVLVSDWVQVLRRWSQDYGFVRSNRVTRWIAPRGLEDLLKRIGSSDQPTRYAITGTLAAAEWAAYAPARLAMIYVEDAELAAELWGLRSADAGANVMLAEPVYDVVFDRSLVNQQEVIVAKPTQVAVDLMTGPGRNPSEAEELLEWMKRNEQSWRN
jgi:hypothetical protein